MVLKRLLEAATMGKGKDRSWSLGIGLANGSSGGWSGSSKGQTVEAAVGTCRVTTVAVVAAQQGHDMATGHLKQQQGEAAVLRQWAARWQMG